MPCLKVCSDRDDIVPYFFINLSNTFCMISFGLAVNTVCLYHLSLSEAQVIAK